ncbi:outer membrane lipoprotein [Syntrophus gentianae]|uniref:Outer membrane lipoprotein n=1 Tax=Syntrophus gentianae TaxID=43775 RepID=A0A1H7ZBP7_9BACT|nr:Slp family lipoprotein [Syntrophus gentianae]SEM55982.1 outer membrane lipoprotein [Syntrophus gentianae]
MGRWIAFPFAENGVAMIRGTRLLIFFSSFLIISTLFITGCNSVISKPVLDSVDRTITFPELKDHPERFLGKTVLFGGEIVTTTVKKGETWIEVVQKPLDRESQPRDTDQSEGRFLILFKGSLDPAIYVTGRKIAVAGEVQGKKVLPLSEMEYSYPVILPGECHVWQPAELYGGPRFGIGVGIGVGGVIR